MKLSLLDSTSNYLTKLLGGEECNQKEGVQAIYILICKMTTKLYTQVRITFLTRSAVHDE